MILKLLFLNLFFSFASAQTVTPMENKLPLELVFLTKSLNETKSSPDEKIIIHELIKEINQNFKFISKEQMYFISKTEIYKNVLEKEFHENFKIRKFTSMDIEQIEKNYIKNKVSYSEFARWLVESIISDFNELKSYPGFNNVSLDIPQKDPILKQIVKKLTYLSPWLGAISLLSAKEFNQKLKKMMIRALEDIKNSTWIYKTLTGAALIADEDFFNFKMKNIKTSLPGRDMPKEENQGQALDGSNEKESDLKKEASAEYEKARDLVESMGVSDPTIPSEPQPAQAENWEPKEKKDPAMPTPIPSATPWTPEN